MNNDSHSASDEGSRIPAACFGPRILGVVLIHALLFALYRYLFAKGPFLVANPDNPDEFPTGSFLLLVLIVLFGAFLLSLASLGSMFVAACLSPDPDRGAKVIAFLYCFGRGARRIFLFSFGLFQCFVLGLTAYGIEERQFAFVWAGWGCAALPTVLVALIVGESRSSYYRRNGFVPRPNPQPECTAPVVVPTESLALLEQVLKAGVPLSTVQKELATLLQRTEQPIQKTNDAELLKALETDIAAVRGSGKDSRIVDAEIEYIRNEFHKRHPHLRKP